MKVLDVSSLHEGIRGMTQQLSQLEKQLNGVENSIRSFVASKDSFRGNGANAIRRFYEYAHLPFLQFFQSFLANFQSKLKQLQFEMDGLEGDSRGFIDESFLSSELEDGLNQINRMVAELTGETNAQLSHVSDIVYLPRLQDHHFHEGMQQAKQSATQTVDKLHQFDHQQTQSFTALVEDLTLIKRYIEEMNQQFESGKINVKNFSPVMLQDLEAYGKLQTRLYNQTVMQRWNSQHYPELGVFYPELGVFYSVGHAASFDQWVNPSCARPEPKKKSVLESLWDFNVGFGEGFINFGKETVEGVVRLVTEPHVVIKETVEFVSEVAENPAILAAIAYELYHTFDTQVIHGDADSRGEWFGYAVPAVGSILAGGSGAVKGIGKLSKIGSRTEIDLKMNLSEIHTSALSAVKATGKVGVDKLRELMTNLAPRRDMQPVPVMAGDVPFNVFNAKRIKDSLKDMHSEILTRIESVAAGNGTLKVNFTKDQLATKPMYSPVPDKWIKKGGTVEIDIDGTWVYINKKGQTVRYPNGFPDFTEYYHPTVQPVNIEIANPTNRPLDYKNANIKAGLNKNSDPPVASLYEAPEGYTWHHHQDGVTMILVDKKIHREFTHAGGVSIINNGR